MAKIIISNWKMNPESVEEAIDFAHASDEGHSVIAAPAPFLHALKTTLKKASLGAQDLFWEDHGAFTGAISGSQLSSCGVMYCIVGHSERRKYFGETDETVAKKINAALKHSITPILCIGETRNEHARGETRQVIENQLRKSLEGIQNIKTRKAIDIIITYEPSWAISTEKDAHPDTTENMVEMVGAIKKTLETIQAGRQGRIQAKIIYGGSVTVKNAEEILKEPSIEGALVGGASIRKEEIKKILEIASHYD